MSLLTDEKKKIILDRSGFTLIEIMVASGILVITLVGIMQLGSQGAASGKSNTVDLDLGILTSNIQTILTSDCTNAMKGASFTVGQPTPNPSLGPLTIHSTGYVVAALPSPGSSPVGLVITSISLNLLPVPIATGGVATTIEYRTNLNVQANKVAGPGAKLLGAPSYSKDFPITVWVDTSTNPGTILGCQGAAPPTGATLVVSSSCVAGNPAVAAQWSVNSGSVYAAEVVDNLGNSHPLSSTASTITTFQVPTGNYTYTLLLTNSMGVQSYSGASPVNLTVRSCSCTCSPTPANIAYTVTWNPCDGGVGGTAYGTCSSSISATWADSCGNPGACYDYEGCSWQEGDDACNFPNNPPNPAYYNQLTTYLYGGCTGNPGYINGCTGQCACSGVYY